MTADIVIRPVECISRCAVQPLDTFVTTNATVANATADTAADINGEHSTARRTRLAAALAEQTVYRKLLWRLMPMLMLAVHRRGSSTAPMWASRNSASVPTWAFGVGVRHRRGHFSTRATCCLKCQAIFRCSLAASAHDRTFLAACVAAVEDVCSLRRARRDDGTE